MKTIQKTINLFKFSELSEDAKENAIYQYAQTLDYVPDAAGEFAETVLADTFGDDIKVLSFCDRNGAELSELCISFKCLEDKLHPEDKIFEETRKELAFLQKWLKDQKLTAEFVGDSTVFDGAENKDPRDAPGWNDAYKKFTEDVKKALKSDTYALIMSDIEYQYSAETISQWLSEQDEEVYLENGYYY